VPYLYDALNLTVDLTTVCETVCYAIRDCVGVSGRLNSLSEPGGKTKINEDISRSVSQSHGQPVHARISGDQSLTMLLPCSLSFFVSGYR